MSQKVLNKVNNDIFSYDTSDGVGVFKMSRVMPTEIHHATGGIGTSGYILTSTGTSGNGWTWSSVNLTDLSDAIATANSLYIGTGSGTISTGNNNTFLGINSGNLNVLGYLNTFIGFSSGEKNDSGFENTFIGAYSGLNNDDGKYNTFIGMSSGILNTSGRENTFVGGNSGYSNKASYNTFVGVNSGYATVDGYSNTFIGTQSGLINTSGRENTFVGVNSGQLNLDGIWNTFIGLQSGFSNSSGSNNTFVGLNAGYYSTESNNTFLGTNAGFHNRAGTNNVAIGYNTQFKQDPGGTLGVYNTSDNEIVIGSSAIGNGSNTITLGNTNSTQLYLPGLQTGATAGDVLTLTAGGDIALATPSSSSAATSLTGSSYDITVVDNGTIPRLHSNAGNAFPNNVHVFYADQAGLLFGGTGSNHYQITVVDHGTIPRLHSNAGNSFPNNVHVFYADQAGYAGYTPILNGGGHSVYVVNVGVPQLRCNTGSAAPNNVHVFYADYSGAVWPSDDRIKWNETLLNKDRSTNIIKDIKFYQYDILKRPLRDTYDTYDPSKCRTGFGVIAQEVEALKVKYPELSDVVENTTVNGDIKAVNYNNLFSIMGATIQNLIKSVETLEAKVKTLESK